jgi:hypothetical protein
MPTMARYIPRQHDTSLAGSTRAAVDSLVQGSLVELFAAYEVAVAPLPRMAGPNVAAVPPICVGIGFKCNGSHAAGKLTLSLSNELLDHMKAGEPESLKVDWARELGNQLIGRIKNRLLPFALRLDIGAALMLEAGQLAQRLQGAPDMRVYAGRTRRGPVLVTLQGVPDDASLRYVGTAPPAEGTMLWL